MKILFFGSSEYCLPILESLQQNFELVGIITKSKSLFESKAEVPIFTPTNKDELLGLKETLDHLHPDLAVVSDYGIIIPSEIFNLPKKRSLNIHFSRLPQYRGPSPVQFTILNGDKNAWISVHFLEVGLDTGDILWQKEVSLAGRETTGSLYTHLFKIASDSLPKIINDYLDHNLSPTPQDHTQATFTKILTREDGFIPPLLLEKTIKGEKIGKDELSSWHLFTLLSANLFTLRSLGEGGQPTTIIERAVRAFSPWPELWTEIKLKVKSEKLKVNEKRIKILKAHLESTTTPSADGPQPITKLILDKVQLEGKNPVTWRQFSEGYPDFSF